MTSAGAGAGLAEPRSTGLLTADFADFYTSTWSDLAGFTTALVGSAAVGDELAQEAFVRLYARFTSIREPPPGTLTRPWTAVRLRPCVFRIATNLARRHNGRRREAPLALASKLIAPAVGVDPQLLDAVRRLPTRLQVVVLLHYYADLPVQDVAQALKRPVGSVKRQLSEARAVLAVTLGEPPGPARSMPSASTNAGPHLTSRSSRTRRPATIAASWFA